MNHTPAQIVRQFYLDEELVVEPGSSGSWPAYIGHMPDGEGSVDDCVTIYDTTGVKDGRLMSGANIFHEGVQVRVRSTSYTTGWKKAWELAEALAGILRKSLDLDSDSYIIQSVTQSTVVVPLGAEEGTKRRDHFTVNFLVTLKEA